jgi:pSer/pThr/pTyr-binding forkhead associated (FHA) protein
MRLRVRVGDRSDEIELSKSPILFGTLEHADVPLVEVRGVNRRHALLAHYLGGWVVHDLAAINGVRLNGKRVRRAEVKVGDTMVLGVAAIDILDTGLQLEEAPSDDWAADILSGVGEGAVFASRCRLIISRDEELVAEIDADRDRLIGHSPRSDVVLPRDGGCSSLHALMAKDSGGWYVHDLKSDRGVFFRGGLVGTAPVADGDLIQLGDYCCAVELLRDSALGKPLAAPAMELVSSASLGHSSGNVVIPGSDASGSGFDLGILAVAPHAIEMAKQARISHRLGHFDQAVRLLVQACRDAPWVTMFRQQLRVAQRMNVGREPTDPAPNRMRLLWHQWRAHNAMKQGRLESALHRAELGLAIDPWNRGLLMTQARIFEEKQHYDLALWSLLAARLRSPHDPHLNRPAAKIYHHLGAYDKAAAFWRLVQKANPDDREPEDQIKRVLVDKTLKKGAYNGAK